MRLLSCFKSAKQRFNKERFQLAENLQSARCSLHLISKVHAARMRKLITARGRKNKRTARKDHSIPLQEYFTTIIYAKFVGQTECIMRNLKVAKSFI